MQIKQSSPTYPITYDKLLGNYVSETQVFKSEDYFNTYIPYLLQQYADGHRMFGRLVEGSQYGDDNGSVDEREAKSAIDEIESSLKDFADEPAAKGIVKKPTIDKKLDMQEIADFFWMLYIRTRQETYRDISETVRREIK